MSRHAAFLAPDPLPTASLRIEVAWPALVARGDLGASTNAFIDPPAEVRPASPGGAGMGLGLADASPAVRRLRIVATIESIANDPRHVRFALHVEEDGTSRPTGPLGVLRGSIARVGSHLHVRVDDPRSAGTALLTVVVDDSGRPLMVRGHVAELAGLAPGAPGRPVVLVLASPSQPVAKEELVERPVR